MKIEVGKYYIFSYPWKSWQLADQNKEVRKKFICIAKILKKTTDNPLDKGKFCICHWISKNKKLIFLNKNGRIPSHRFIREATEKEIKLFKLTEIK